MGKDDCAAVGAGVAAGVLLDDEAPEPVPVVAAGVGAGVLEAVAALALGWKSEGRPPHPTSARAVMDRAMAGGTYDFISNRLWVVY